MLAELCPPALIYLIFSTTQVVIDTIKGFYNTAFLKIWVTFAFTILLNVLCQRGLGIVSWIIVFVPFILMTLIISILLIMFGLNPTTGRTKVYKKGQRQRKPIDLDGNDHKEVGKDGGGIGPPWSWGKKSVPGVPQSPGKKSVPGVPQSPGGQGYIVKPIVVPPDQIQQAYVKPLQGDKTPNGMQRGPDSELKEEHEESVDKTAGGKTSGSSQKAMDDQKAKRAWGDGKAWPTGSPGGEKPSSRAGEANNNCQAFCNAACTPQCKSWKCPNCIPPAPANLAATCKSASAACNQACTAPAAQVCLVDQNYLDPRKECIGWAPCMVLNKVNRGSLAAGLPAGSPKHAAVATAAGGLGNEDDANMMEGGDRYAQAQVVRGNFADTGGFGGQATAAGGGDQSHPGEEKPATA